MWWEVVCEKNQKLSRKNAKDQLKNALNKDSKPELMKFFNQPVPNAANLKLAIDENNDAFSGDSNNTQRDQMLNVFCNLDKKLGNQARGVFGMDPVEEESFIQKVKGLLTGSKPEIKRTKSMGEPKNRPNLETLEQTISSEAAPQPGGNNLTFDQNKVAKINNIFQQFGIPESGKMDDFYAKNKKDLTNGKKAIKEIQKSTQAPYDDLKNGRKPFLVGVANYLFIKNPFDIKSSKNKIAIQDICQGKTTDLKKEYRDNAAILAVQRVRNLIKYGLNLGDHETLPDISNI